MKTVLAISSTLNYGSTGRIVERLGLMAGERGWRCVVAHGPRLTNPSALEHYCVGSRADELVHGGVQSLLLDRHGLGSARATRRLIDYVRREVRPDIVHLHNIHGYYLNYPLLFEYLREADVPVVWTLHDCWAFTGHCSNSDAIGCERWQEGCGKCPGAGTYPKALVDRSRANFALKQRLFTALGDRLTLVPVSEFLAAKVRKSMLGNCNIQVIHNGIDLDVFRPSAPKAARQTVLGAAAPWMKEKGLYDFYELRKLLPREEWDIVLVGLKPKEIAALPAGIRGLERTEDTAELARLYSAATVFVNPTHQDNYPTVDLEAMACGTPVAAYRTGGVAEAIVPGVGVTVERGDVRGLAEGVRRVATECTSAGCRAHAEACFDAKRCFEAYFRLYERVMR